MLWRMTHSLYQQWDLVSSAMRKPSISDHLLDNEILQPLLT